MLSLAKAGKSESKSIPHNLYFSNAYGDNDGNDHQDFDDSNYATVEHDDHHDKWSNLANPHASIRQLIKFPTGCPSILSFNIVIH